MLRKDDDAAANDAEVVPAVEAAADGEHPLN
jgi:hypothetical protein